MLGVTRKIILYLRVYEGIDESNRIDIIEYNIKKIDIYLYTIWMFERKDMKIIYLFFKSGMKRN